MTPLLRTALSRPIVSNSLKVSLIVGSILNAINQGSTIMAGGGVSWFHLTLNYLVPYCVASYSGATARLRQEHDE
ncbi:MAG TPA: nitrate/nitrite transporter NrtS [Burkholderiaceae bacterium]|nr:nitrate/nitrite transporter NrtS [Burkholderiaceae bacterium]